jgi:hypothetical protein
MLHPQWSLPTYLCFQKVEDRAQKVLLIRPIQEILEELFERRQTPERATDISFNNPIIWHGLKGSR